MKHYIVGITTDKHIFELKCNTISEAYNAVIDAVQEFKLEHVCLDKIMTHLVEMDMGKAISASMYHIKIWVENNEV